MSDTTTRGLADLTKTPEPLKPELVEADINIVKVPNGKSCPLDSDKVNAETLTHAKLHEDVTVEDKSVSLADAAAKLAGGH